MKPAIPRVWLPWFRAGAATGLVACDGSCCEVSLLGTDYGRSLRAAKLMFLLSRSQRPRPLLLALLYTQRHKNRKLYVDIILTG
ncbi:hypothetical protein BJV77DRAFT_1022897 [Russula vinacea]|jgi:hypothetical protein|nr:hypothetical protein BJV77DRAFT_1022897 [Russula vinacea]